MGRYVVLCWVDDEEEAIAAYHSHDARPPLYPDNGSKDDHLKGVKRAFASILRPLGFNAETKDDPDYESETIVGFAGMWLMLDESHVTTICVAERFRGQGFGEVLFSALMDSAADMGATRVTLEVRVSNNVAQALYQKYGFKTEGIRKRYYSDNNEDALIMWSESMSDPKYQAHLVSLKAELNSKIKVRSLIQPASMD